MGLPQRAAHYQHRARVYSDALIRRRTRRLRASSYIYITCSPPPPVSLYAYAAAWSRCELCVSHRRDEPLLSTLHTQHTNKKKDIQDQPSYSTTTWLYTRLRLSFSFSLERERERKALRRAIIACLDLSSSINIVYHDSINPVDQNCCGPDWFFSSPSLYVFRFPFFFLSFFNMLRCSSSFFLLLLFPVMAGPTADEITRPDWNSKKQKKRKVIFLHHRWSVMTEQENLNKNQNVGPLVISLLLSSVFFFVCAAKTFAGRALRWAPHVGQHGDPSSSLLCPRPNSFT